jgi:hypothetical protein
MLTETDSIRLVMDYEEKRVGQRPKDVSRKKRLGYDLESVDRLIEVKKRGIEYGFVFLTIHELNFFQKNDKAYLYLVYEKEGKPKMKIFDNDTVKKNCLPATVRYRFHMRKAVKESSEEIEL